MKTETQHTPTYKVEYQQYSDGAHVCVAWQNGDWVADCGPEGEKDSEDNARLFAAAPETAVERDELKKWKERKENEYNLFDHVSKERDRLKEALKELRKRYDSDTPNNNINKNLILRNADTALATGDTTPAQTKSELSEIADRLASVRAEWEMSDEVSASILSEIESLNAIIDVKGNNNPRQNQNIKAWKQAAKLLVDTDTNSEYIRGICELLADMDGIPDVYHDDRTEQIARELGFKDPYSVYRAQGFNSRREGGPSN